VSEDDGSTVPPPLILDTGVLIAIARGDAGLTGLLMDYDAAGQPLIIPPLGVVAALTDMRTADAARALRGLEQLENVQTAVLASVSDAAIIAYVIGHTEMEPADAQAAAVALTEAGRILTFDAAKWRLHVADLDQQLFIVEIADPEDAG
jgi:predicted nucleic acid-binding protein